MAPFRIDLTEQGSGTRQTLCRLDGQKIAITNRPVHASARYLLAHGLAEEIDTIETFRGEVHECQGRRGVEVDSLSLSNAACLVADCRRVRIVANELTSTDGSFLSRRASHRLPNRGIHAVEEAFPL